MLSAGHRWSDIQDYTLSQFTLFCKAAIRQHALQQAELISAVAIGAQGTDKSIKETVDKVSKQAK